MSLFEDSNNYLLPDLSNNSIEDVPKGDLDKSKNFVRNAHLFLSDFSSHSYKKYLKNDIPVLTYHDANSNFAGNFDGEAINLNNASDLWNTSTALHEYEHSTLRNYRDNNLNNKFWRNISDRYTDKILNVKNRINLKHRGIPTKFDQFLFESYLKRRDKAFDKSNLLYNYRTTLLLNKTFDLKNDDYYSEGNDGYESIGEAGSTLRQALYAIYNMAKENGLSYKQLLKNLKKSPTALGDIISNTNNYGKSYINRLNDKRRQLTNLLDYKSDPKKWQKNALKQWNRYNRNLYKGLLRFREQGGRLNYLNYIK